MLRHLNTLIKSYFFFYALTYTGSALTSVSSFLMVDKVFNSMEGIVLALALKTAFMAIMSPLLGKILARLPLRTTFWISQLLGPVLLIPLYLGIANTNPTLFLVGISIGGLPMLVLNFAGTSYLKKISNDDLNNFRQSQGHLQLVVGVCFVLSAFAAPFLLKLFSYEVVLCFDLLSYIIGAVFVYFLRNSMDRWEHTQVPPSSNMATPKLHGKITLSVFFVAISIVMAYLLKGLPPMIASEPALTSGLGLETTARQSLWAFEALAAIVAGVVYKRWHANLEQIKFFHLGLMNALWLLIAVALQNYSGLAGTIFLLSLSMTLTFMKTRDDFIASFSTNEGTFWATGIVNLVMNFTLTISPLLIGLTVSTLGQMNFVLATIAVQLGVFIFILFAKKPAA